MMMKKSLYVGLGLLGISMFTYACAPKTSSLSADLVTSSNCEFQVADSVNPLNVFPNPVSVRFDGKTIPMPKGITLEKPEAISSDVATPAQKVLSALFSKGSFPVTFIKPSAPVTSDEMYRLEIKPDGIIISASSASGYFYATQTLKQLVYTFDGKKRSTLPVCTIEDSPSIRFRGVVEGFYSKPEPGWNHEGRISLIRFFGQYKMNTYIYGPKDDPYHGFSGKRWREPYPADEAEKIKELLRESKENCVNFVWTVHTGGDPDWKDKPEVIRDACMTKFEAMYQLGVRSFGFFFDDVGGAGTKAENQVMLLNYLNQNFVKVKGDVTPLVMCPTQYNKSWSDKKPGSYLDILGDKLDKDIMIMWTGNSVCCDITEEGLQWINNRIKRSAYIWWNWPVQDFCRNHLTMGRTYGCQTKDPSLYSGFVSNPMNKSEASKVALFGVADYCWNMKGFESTKSWQQGIKLLYPECHEAMQTFCDHNSDQGPNGHGYRRVESENIKPRVDEAMKAMNACKGDFVFEQNLATALRTEFEKLESASKTLLRVCPDTSRLISEIWPWICGSELLGNMGALYVNALTTAPATPATLLGAPVCLENFKSLNDAVNQNGWQNGIQPASLVMMPLIMKMDYFVCKKAYEQFTGKTFKITSVKAEYKAFTNIPSLKKVSARRDNIYVHLGKILEMVKIEPQQYIGLELPEGLFANYVHVVMDNPEASKQGIIEISQDGKKWRKMNTANHGGELKNGLNVKDKIRYFRYINTSKAPIELKIKQFKFDVPKGAQANTVNALYDCDFHSPFIVDATEGEIFEFAIPDANRSNFIFFGAGDYVFENAEEVHRVRSTECMKVKMIPVSATIIKMKNPKDAKLKLKMLKTQKVKFFEFF